MLNIKPSTQQERELIFIKTLLNATDDVTKVADHGVLAGISKGASKASGKAEKDIMQAMSILFPDSAFAEDLDNCADTFGVADRFHTSSSSTYLRLVGDAGTQYLSNTHLFTAKNGVNFRLEQDTTIGSLGYIYTKVRSLDVGFKTNVDSGSIDKMYIIPTGHNYVINEYRAIGGRDNESDDLFRKRIKDGSNILAKSTIAMIEQVFQRLNSDVMRVIFHGLNDQGELKLAIVTQNGIDLLQSELDYLLSRGGEYLSLLELKPFGRESYGVELMNIEWQPIDISFRVAIKANYNVDDVRKEIQIRISKYMDHSKWKSGGRVEWDKLLQIAQSVAGVEYVPDQYFFPRNDISTDRNKLPRVRGFVMMDTDGILLNGSNLIYNPIYYPSNPDFSFRQSVLTTV